MSGLIIRVKISVVTAILTAHELKHTILVHSLCYACMLTVIIKMNSIQIRFLHYLFNTYSAASGSLNANHKYEISQQQRDGQIQVNKHMDSMQ